MRSNFLEGVANAESNQTHSMHTNSNKINAIIVILDLNVNWRNLEHGALSFTWSELRGDAKIQLTKFIWSNIFISIWSNHIYIDFGSERYIVYSIYSI